MKKILQFLLGVVVFLAGLIAIIWLSLEACELLGKIPDAVGVAIFFVVIGLVTGFYIGQRRAHEMWKGRIREQTELKFFEALHEKWRRAEHCDRLQRMKLPEEPK